MIDDLEIFVKEYFVVCKEMELKGWILVVIEGINGIVLGIVEVINKYMDYMVNDVCFVDMVFKIDVVDVYVFKKMYVWFCVEIVSLSLEEDVNFLEVIGIYLEFFEFCEVLLDEDMVILDVRNDYEFDIGYFCGVVCLDI